MQTASSNSERQPLSEKAKEILRQNRLQRARESEWISFDDGEEKELYINAEKTERIPSRYNPKKTRYVYAATDLTNLPDMEKKWGVTQTTSDILDKYIEQGHSVFLVKREGEGFKLKYHITPRD